MREREIGKLAEYLRKKENIQMKNIYEGICSESMYIRLETGESIPDFQTLTCLFSRLGKSMNKMSMILGYEDYQIYCLQEELQNFIIAEVFDMVEQALEIYRKKKISVMPCHQQYILKIESIILLKKNRYKEALEIIEKAIRITLPQFRISEINIYLLSLEEWTLILLWLRCKFYLKEHGIGQRYKNIISILEKRIMDSELKVELLPKAALIFADIFIADKNIQEAEQVCRIALEFLEEQVSLFLLPQILERLIEVTKMQGKFEETIELERKAYVLCWIYQILGKSVRVQMDLSDIKRSSKIYLITETISGERKQNRMTKSALAEKAELDVKTLSRIEAGIHFPKPKTFRKLMKAVDHEYYIYRTGLVTEDFWLLEIQQEISKEIMRENYVNARKYLETLEKRLSVKFRENRQYILYTKVMIDMQEGKREIEEAIRLSIQALEMTRVFDEKNFTQAILGVEETIIVNYIAKLYRKLGEEGKAIRLLENALAGFDSSQVEDKYHNKEVSLLLESLAMYCETSNELDKALNYCKRGIALEIECGKAGLLGSFLLQQTYIEERMGKNKEQCRKEYCMIYQLLEMMKMNQDKLALERYYHQQYGGHIADDVDFYETEII